MSDDRLLSSPASRSFFSRTQSPLLSTISSCTPLPTSVTLPGHSGTLLAHVANADHARRRRRTMPTNVIQNTRSGDVHVLRALSQRNRSIQGMDEQSFARPEVNHLKLLTPNNNAVKLAGSEIPRFCIQSRGHCVRIRACLQCPRVPNAHRSKFLPRLQWYVARFYVENCAIDPSNSLRSFVYICTFIAGSQMTLRTARFHSSSVT